MGLFDEATAQRERAAAKRAAGLCHVEGCEEPIGSGVLPRCRAHAGIFAGANPLPAKRHRPVQYPAWTA